MSSFLMNTLKTLKKDNAVMNSPDFAKDLSDNDNQYKFLQQVFKSKKDDAFKENGIVHKLEKSFGNIADYKEKQRQDILSGKDIDKVYYVDQVKGYINYLNTITDKKVIGYLYSIIDEKYKEIN